MDQQQIQVNHGQSFCTFKFKDYNNLFNLQEFLKQQFKLARFKLYYKEKDVEMYLESEKQYEEMINNGQVKQLYLKEDYQKEKNYLQLFMDQLFVDNICCEKESQDECVICLEKKEIKPNELSPLVLECLYDLIQKDDFQAFCKKQFKRNIQNVDEFLEYFSKLSRPIKQIVQLVPQNQQQQIQQQQPVQSIIKQGPINQMQSQIFKQNMMRQSYQQRPSDVIKGQSKIGVSMVRQSIIQIQQKYSIEYQDKNKDAPIPEYQPETQIYFEVQIKNNGIETWPDKVYLKQVGHHPQTIHYIPSLHPRQSRTELIPFTTPLNPGRYYYSWVLFYQKPEDNSEIKIGERWNKEFIVKTLSKQDKIQKSTEMLSKKLSSLIPKAVIKSKVVELINERENENIGISQINNIVEAQFDNY